MFMLHGSLYLFVLKDTLNLRNLVSTKNYFGGGGNVGIGVAFPGNK